MECKLNVASLWFPVNTLGCGARLGVWVQGCSRNCKGCISPEFQSYEEKSMLTADEILSLIPQGKIPDGLTISGGEPFEQENGILELIDLFSRKFSDDILIYTGFTLDELKARNSEITDKILSSVSVLIDGEYIEEQNDGQALRGSSNQKIHIFRHAERYADIINGKRKLQGVLLNQRLWFIGIPPI